MQKKVPQKNEKKKFELGKQSQSDKEQITFLTQPQSAFIFHQVVSHYHCAVSHVFEQHVPCNT